MIEVERERLRLAKLRAEKSRGSRGTIKPEYAARVALQREIVRLAERYPGITCR